MQWLNSAPVQTTLKTGRPNELIFFRFKILSLHNYRVKCFDYIVKLGSGVACNLCGSLDIALILA